MNRQLIYKIIITQDPETGFFVAEVPSLSPCITFGETVQEALAMAHEAIEGVVESRIANGYDLPDDVQKVNTQRSPIEMFISYDLPVTTA